MNAGESQHYFLDSNIWLYRFIINASAFLGDANILYSEDMQDGLILENTLQIVNPFRGLNS